jgi:multimeric flavodoxin WrbA
MKVLGLAGSARRGGNSETLLDWCLAAARKEGATVVKFSLCELDLHGCQACDACFKEGVCIQKDDMHMLYPHLRTADSIVLAAPVYFQGMPAVPKMVIDRCQPFWAQKYLLEQPIAPPGSPQRLGAFLSCGGTKLTHAFEGSQRIMRTLWHTLDVTPAGEVLCPGIDEKGKIRDEAGARVAAEQVGRRLAHERPAERKAAMPAEVKVCISCGKPLVDRVEEIERTGSGGSRSTGECSTYRVWFCANSECPMYQTDIYQEAMADRTDR